MAGAFFMSEMDGENKWIKRTSVRRYPDYPIQSGWLYSPVQPSSRSPRYFGKPRSTTVRSPKYCSTSFSDCRKKNNMSNCLNSFGFCTVRSGCVSDRSFRLCRMTLSLSHIFWTVFSGAFMRSLTTMWPVSAEKRNHSQLAHSRRLCRIRKTMTDCVASVTV